MAFTSFQLFHCQVNFNDGLVLLAVGMGVDYCLTDLVRLVLGQSAWILTYITLEV